MDILSIHGIITEQLCNKSGITNRLVWRMLKRSSVKLI